MDRFYIEAFLAEHRRDLRGRILEVHDSGYTDRLGAGVELADVLDIDPTNPRATMVADLAAAHSIPADLFDCFVLTQTLQLIYDVRAAIGHAHRVLRPGGVLLATVPSVSKVVSGEGLTDYWRFTTASCRALFGSVFGDEQVDVRSYGNVLTCMSFLSGLAHEELSREDLETHDERFPLIVAVRAVKR